MLVCVLGIFHMLLTLPRISAHFVYCVCVPYSLTSVSRDSDYRIPVGPVSDLQFARVSLFVCWSANLGSRFDLWLVVSRCQQSSIA